MRTLGAVLGLGLLAAITVGSYQVATHIEKAVITVQSKERLMEISTTDGRTTTTYRNVVYTADEVYEVQDSFWNGHFTSATVYARLREGSVCAVTLSGYRVGFLSMFQNIIEAECRAVTP